MPGGPIQSSQDQKNQHHPHPQEQFLRNALSAAKYGDEDRACSDLLDVLAQYPGLGPAAEDYVFNDGSEEFLVGLSGTIPLPYKGSTYNIPIQLWLLHTYPYNAPLVFVRPTPDMRIKITSYVKPDGKVSLPYLQEWKHTSSDLLLLIQVLIISFQEDPPVYTPSFPIQLQPTAAPLPAAVSMVPNVQYPYPQSQELSPERLNLLPKVAEKMINRLISIYTSTCMEQARQDQLKSKSQSLTSVLVNITESSGFLESKVSAMEQEISVLDSKIAELRVDVEERETNVQDSIQAPLPLYRQIVEANAKDQAIDDTMFYIYIGILNGRLELGQYQRTVRKLGRDQFMLRATIDVCRARAGLHH